MTKKLKKRIFMGLASTAILLGITLIPANSVEASNWPYCIYSSHGAMQQITRANDCTNSWCKGSTYYFKCSQCSSYSVVCLSCGQHY
ncbi:hypothetical protein [Lacrimispora celerecrescens]|uniref:Uncharacterized protein n=1 Tax=[Clostridium] celerecrescens 18A TaxID=1286362 RepID=A0A2M8YZT5_9FIRM|nr:hypothetical protein [Lacrimispora celerecrescens]PJJ26706.1 hypothetical protein H171_0146 [[Clostridium] celerecrescens 18A]